MISASNHGHRWDYRLGHVSLVPVRSTRPDVLTQRRAGLLLHPTSLPGPFDFGVLGPDAYRFVDFLRDAGFSVWQTLPLHPVDETLSPYLLRSAHAGNPRLINLDLEPGIRWRIPEKELLGCHNWDARRNGLQEACERFDRQATEVERAGLDSFLREASSWIRPFALFESLGTEFEGRPWWEWPQPLRQREPDAIRKAGAECLQRIHQIEFEQYLFNRQWNALKNYAHRQGVYLFGDVPIYVAPDSVDVWWRRELFKVDEAGQASSVAGVPPDYFSEDGQLWGNPVYDWDQVRSEGFRWWIDRLKHQLLQFDLLRVDHFRALESYWEVPRNAATARQGRWVNGPGDRFLEAIGQEIPLAALVAEDLGWITPAVQELRERWKLPGMLVLQFAFDGSLENPFLPENHGEHAVVYTGTHDNDTTVGWYQSLGPETRRLVDRLLHIPPHTMPRALIEAAYASPARLAVIPMQDVLGLGSEHRMNRPGTRKGNWKWRYRWDDVDAGLKAEYRSLADLFRRI